MEQNIKYPIDAETWEIKRTLKRIIYSIRKLEKSDYFGHEEILSNQLKRTTQVICKTRCRILYINKTDFLEHFN